VEEFLDVICVTWLCALRRTSTSTNTLHHRMAESQPRTFTTEATEAHRGNPRSTAHRRDCRESRVRRAEEKKEQAEEGWKAFIGTHSSVTAVTSFSCSPR